MNRIPLVLGLLLALCAPATAQEVDQRLLSCIAHIVYGESRDEPMEGQFAVAWSLVFRAAVNMPYFGGSDICDVAYKHGPNKYGKIVWQYDGAKIAVTDKYAWDASVYVAYYTLLGQGQPNMPIMFFCSTRVYGACRGHDKAYNSVGEIGGHRFYLDPMFPALMEASMQ